MNRSEITTVLSRAETCEVEALAETIRRKYEIEMIKPPKKTLVMVKVRESVKRSLFYLGELLACECMVSVAGTHGVSVTAGDDFRKAIAAAIIDGAVTANLDEAPQLLAQLRLLREKQERERARMNGELLKSKVNFKVMGGEE